MTCCSSSSIDPIIGHRPGENGTSERVPPELFFFWALLDFQSAYNSLVRHAQLSSETLRALSSSSSSHGADFYSWIECSSSNKQPWVGRGASCWRRSSMHKTAGLDPRSVSVSLEIRLPLFLCFFFVDPSPHCSVQRWSASQAHHKDNPFRPSLPLSLPPPSLFLPRFFFIQGGIGRREQGVKRKNC